MKLMIIIGGYDLFCFETYHFVALLGVVFSAEFDRGFEVEDFFADRFVAAAVTVSQFGEALFELFGFGF